MSTEYIHELGDCLSTSGSNAGPHVKVIAPEKYKVSGSETYKAISEEIDVKADGRCFHAESLAVDNSVTKCLKMTFSGRVGRAVAVVAIGCENGGISSVFRLSWFHDGTSVGNVGADIISCGDLSQKPIVYYDTDCIYIGLGNSGNLVASIALMVSCDDPANISYSQVTRATATASGNTQKELTRSGQTVANIVTDLSVPGNISNTYYPSSKAVEDALKRVRKCHVEALQLPNAKDYGFVEVGLYDSDHAEPVLTPTTYDSDLQTYYIGGGDFSSLVYRPGVWNPTITYRCEEFYVNYEWTASITKSLSLYDFFVYTTPSNVYFRHFVFTINNYGSYAMTLKIFGGINHDNDVDIYSNIANPTTELSVAVAAKRVTRIDVRLLFRGVGTSGSKSAVVTVM